MGQNVVIEEAVTFDHDHDGTYMCVYCDNDCDESGCDYCGEYKGVMSYADYMAYTAKYRS